MLRYDLRTASGAGTLYAKVFGPQRFAAIEPLTIALADPAVGRRLVPELTAVWPGLQTTVSAGVRGRAASKIMGDAAVPADQRTRLAHRLGDLLARFHQQDHVVAPHRSAAEQVAALTPSVHALRLVDPRLGDRLDAVLEQLSARVPAVDGTVLAHGGFRAGQVVVGSGGQLVVLDTDGACWSGPGRDMGTVLAHLTWQGIRQPEQRAVLCEAQRGLVAGYESRRGASEPDSLLWWRALGLVQVAVRRYRRLETESWGTVPALVDAAAEALAAPPAGSARGPGVDVFDVSVMTRVLRAALARGTTSTDVVEVVSARELPSAPGRRSVVRYVVDGLEADQPAALVGKRFNDPQRASLLQDHLRRLHDGPFGAGELRVPEPVAFVASHRLVLYRHCDGTPLDRVSEPVQLEDGVRRAARWLARLHTSDVRLLRTFSLEQEEESTRRWAHVVADAHPELAAAALALADGWARVARSVGPLPAAPIHKDFHPGHVLVGDDLYVIDLDEARQGDPAFDLAHFCAYLELSDEGRAGASRAFLEEYASATGWSDEGSYAPFCAYAWLKIAKQWTVGSAILRDSGADERRAGAARALAKGREWLSE